LQNKGSLMAHILDHPQSQELGMISAIIDSSPTICLHIPPDPDDSISQAQIVCWPIRYDKDQEHDSAK
jgi:hypothetical protein